MSCFAALLRCAAGSICDVDGYVGSKVLAPEVFGFRGSFELRSFRYSRRLAGWRRHVAATLYKLSRRYHSQRTSSGSPQPSKDCFKPMVSAG